MVKYLSIGIRNSLFIIIFQWDPAIASLSFLLFLSLFQNVVIFVSVATSVCSFNIKQREREKLRNTQRKQFKLGNFLHRQHRKQTAKRGKKAEERSDETQGNKKKRRKYWRKRLCKKKASETGVDCAVQVRMADEILLLSHVYLITHFSAVDFLFLVEQFYVNFFLGTKLRANTKSKIE